MKLCIDCKHIREPNRKSFEKCGAPQNIKRVDPVNGEKVVGWIYCEFHRKHGPVLSRLSGQCGRQGRWFEPNTATPRD